MVVKALVPAVVRDAVDVQILVLVAVVVDALVVLAQELAAVAVLVVLVV